jgi:hypothetical protein
MLAFILLAVLVVTIFLFRDLLDCDPSRINEWRDSFLAAVIILAGMIALSSEALSLLRALTQPGLVVFWLIVLLLLAFTWKRGAFKRFGGIGEWLDWRGWSNTERLLLLSSVLYTAILFVVARLAPPNTNDSLSYHLSRVMHWIQNQALVHYPTTIDRQLWMPPWAEMAIMQLHLLKGDDGLSNLVQWFSMLSSLVVVSLIARRLGANLTGQLFAVSLLRDHPDGDSAGYQPPRQII